MRAFRSTLISLRVDVHSADVFQFPGDRRVLESFRRGEPETLDRIYRTFSQDVARFLTRSTGNSKHGRGSRSGLLPHDLQAAHQETFIRAFRPAARASYDGISPYLGYLLAIARTTAVDLFRSNRFHDWVPLDAVPEVFEQRSESPDPEQAALVSEVQSLVQRFLESLPHLERRLVALRFIDGLSQHAVAETLGLSRSEVRTREDRLRSAIASYLLQAGWPGVARSGTARFSVD